MTASTLGTKRKCPDCSARFYDLAAPKVQCPKCSYDFPDAPAELVKDAAVIAIAAIEKAPQKVAKAPQNSDDDDAIEVFKNNGEIATLEDLDDYDDVEHLEEVEEHHEDLEVDVNSDDADDEMFMGELDNGDAKLLSEFESRDEVEEVRI